MTTRTKPQTVEEAIKEELDGQWAWVDDNPPTMRGWENDYMIEFERALVRVAEIVRTTLTQSHQEELEEIKKAFGGCTKCYGKGYHTTLDFTVGHEDFGGEGFFKQNPVMRFCTCDRGKQLKELL